MSIIIKMNSSAETIQIINFPPLSQEFYNAKGRRYGQFKLATVRKDIWMPNDSSLEFIQKGSDEKIVLLINMNQLLTIKETEFFTIKTNFHFLLYWLKYYSENSNIGDIYLNLLANIENSDLLEVQNLFYIDTINIKIPKDLERKYYSKKPYYQSIEMRSKGILQDFKKRVFKNCEFYLWDKQLQEYIPQIDCYEIINNPAPACGNSKCYYEYAGESIHSYLVKLY